jgi:hypothetical protein
MSLPLHGATSASATRTGSAAAYERSTDEVRQTARKTEAIHRQARVDDGRCAGKGTTGLRFHLSLATQVVRGALISEPHNASS